jgi:hypothetical protein
MSSEYERRRQERQLSKLINNVMDGVSSDEEFAELMELLRNSETARQAWREAMTLHAELGQLVNPMRPFSAAELLVMDEKLAAAGLRGEECTPVTPPRVPLLSGSSWARPLVYATAACVAVFVAAALLVPAPAPQKLLSERTPVVVATPDDEMKAIAYVVRSVGSDLNLGEGTASGLSIGQVVEFSRGLVELEIDGGVTLVAYGPARLRIDAKDEVRLDFGRVTAVVEEGYEGFRVATHQALVTDLGTSFSVDAPSDGASTVRVHSGQVDVQSHRDIANIQRVVQGQQVDVAEAVSVPRQEQTTGSGHLPLVSLVRPHKTVPCQQDAYVIGGGFGDLNKGDSELLFVKLDIKTPTYCRKAWLDFDLSQIPRDSLKAARLVLTIDPNDVADVKHPTNVPSDCNWQFRVSGIWNDDFPAWDESALTWNNAQGHDPADFLGNELGPASPRTLGGFAIRGRGASGEQVVADSPMLIDFLRADRDGRITLMITRETGYTWSSRSEDMVIHSFASKEHPSLPPPTLELWFE